MSHATDGNRQEFFRLNNKASCAPRGDRMFKALSIIIPLLLSPAQAASDNWEVEGSNGRLYVHGSLTESACRLEMSSAFQDVELGDIGIGQLQAINDRGYPVGIELQLRDCLHSTFDSNDMRLTGEKWADNHVPLTISFRGTLDENNPQLVKLNGVSGVGLRIKDAQGQDVRLGRHGISRLLRPDQDTLNYVVSMERTAAPLRVGSYQAVIDFHLSYQ